mmetsp:Transcript_16139/g.34108  ORF Transcript_16139/g.34108 Transcript_16139/m.34108 type:complete len:209 (+) Transcript_16139:1776-2402(+)
MALILRAFLVPPPQPLRHIGRQHATRHEACPIRQLSHAQRRQSTYPSSSTRCGLPPRPQVTTSSAGTRCFPRSRERAPVRDHHQAPRQDHPVSRLRAFNHLVSNDDVDGTRHGARGYLVGILLDAEALPVNEFAAAAASRVWILLIILGAIGAAPSNLQVEFARVAILTAGIATQRRPCQMVLLRYVGGDESALFTSKRSHEEFRSNV